MAGPVLAVTTEVQPKFTDVVRGIHDCPIENTSCQVLYYIAAAMEIPLEIGVDDALLYSRSIPWPTCLLCKRCLVEPAIWRFPLEPMAQLLCAPCFVAYADPSITYGEFPSEEYRRKTWMITEIGSGREMRPFPDDAPKKRKYTGPNGVSIFEKVKATYSVEDIAGRFTDLQPVRPGTLKARCPLHQESTPSFYVWTDKGTWRCFGGCAMGGDVIKLTQELMDRGVLVG